jgi:hypothetical protein
VESLLGDFPSPTGLGQFCFWPTSRKITLRYALTVPCVIHNWNAISLFALVLDQLHDLPLAKAEFTCWRKRRTVTPRLCASCAKALLSERRKSQAITLGDPVMPVADGFLC